MVQIVGPGQLTNLSGEFEEDLRSEAFEEGFWSE